MKKQWKRLAALSSAAVMAAGTLLYFPTDTLQNISWGITASAEETGAVTWTKTEGDNLTWTLYDNGTLTISGSGAMKDYSYDSPAYGNSKIKKVVIENGVTSIGYYAFDSCSNLASIEIPEGVTSIGNSAFKDCRRLTNITIPGSVTSIGYHAFSYTLWLTNKQNESPLVIVNGILIDGTVCSGEVTIPDGVTSIGDYAFSGCSRMTSINIPKSVTSIGNGAFSICTGLTSINIPENVTSIGNGAFQRCSNLASINIPKSVTSIGSNVFHDCTALTEVLLEGGSKLTSENLGVNESIIRTRWNEDNLTWTLTADGTMTISGSGAMKDIPAYNKSNIKKVVIQNGVTSIGKYAFSNCSSLTDITIPDGVTSIGNGAFRHCSGLTSITIPEGVKSIGAFAFFECAGLTSITIPKSVTSIGVGAFDSCTGLTGINIPEGVKSIGAFAFSECTNLTDITISNSVTSIGESAFSGTPWLTNKRQENNSLVIVSGILIDGRTCSGEVTIPDGVISIGNNAFQNCTGLTSIKIPKSVTNIGEFAFSGCGDSLEITVPCDSTLTKNAFGDASEKVKHRHSLIKTDAKDETYTEAGNVEYWTCENCKKHFLSDETDAEAAKEVELSATVKPVPVQVATATTQIKCVYGQDMDEINLQDYVKNADAVGEVSVKVATGSTMLDGMQLDGSKLSGKPTKVYTNGKDVTFTFTAKNGNTADLTLHFLVAKADPTVKVTVDGDSHTEGDLVEKLGLSISKDSTKGAAKIVSELKALAAGKNTLAWEFTPEDSENYNVVTGTVVVNAQTTTTTTTTTTATTTTTTTNKTTDRSQ